MYKISDIISTPVISLYESEYIGIINNIMFDCKSKKIKYACILDEEENIPKTINSANFYKIGECCIFVKNKNQIELTSNCTMELENSINPINLKVYNLECQYIGTSQDIIVDDKLHIQSLILNNGKIIESKEIFNIGKNTIIIGTSNIKLKSLKPTVKKIRIKKIEEKKVLMLKDYIKKEEIHNQNNKIITDFRFLIGRVIRQDIIALNGELIAKKDAVITKEIVNKASNYGKLVEIARYSIS